MTELDLPRLQRERAVDAVYQALRAAIVSYAMRPGDRLNIEDLASKLGVSLTPVRGAIQQLANEGLIEIRPRSGTFVATLSAQDIEETFKIRCALECLAAEESIESLNSLDVRRLKELLKTLKRPIRSAEDRQAHERDNSEFHNILMQGSGNRRLLEMYEELNAHIKIARIHAGESDWPERLQDERAEHEAIVNAIESRDVAGLVAALRKHIYRAKDVLVRAINKREQASSG